MRAPAGVESRPLAWHYTGAMDRGCALKNLPSHRKENFSKFSQQGQCKVNFFSLRYVTSHLQRQKCVKEYLKLHASDSPRAHAKGRARWVASCHVALCTVIKTDSQSLTLRELEREAAVSSSKVSETLDS